MGWTHNSVLLVYVEESRIEYFREVLDIKMEEINGAIVHQDIDYKNPVNYGNIVTVCHRISEIGQSSLTTKFRVKNSGETAAEGEVIYSLLDETNTPRRLPDEWKNKIQEFEPRRVELED
jgi:YbgC/YbaW family acyl-CoA thioester hydrolase